MGELFRQAMNRLSAEEQGRERKIAPYPLSLYALSAVFAEAGARQGWLSENPEPVLVACSGGGDSMAALWLFRTLYGGKVAAAHVNHGLRGRESDGDAAFARKMAEGWGLPFLERRVSLPEGESLEAGARRARFAALSEMAAGWGARWVVLAHNRDDLAETVLFNLLRGTGVRGSVGMPERRGVFVRPLLGLRRAFLRRVLAVRGIPWREDETNERPDVSTRNFLRLELLPLIERRVNAGAVEHLAAFAEAMRGGREEEEGRGRALFDEAALDERALDRRRAAALPLRDRALLIREAGRRLGLAALSRRRAEELSRLMGRGGPFTFQWGGGMSVLGLKDKVQFKREES